MSKRRKNAGEGYGYMFSGDFRTRAHGDAGAMSKRRKNAGEGYGYMFSGAFNKKSDAVKKEKQRKGSFVKAVFLPTGMRYAVMTPRTNPIKRKKKAKKETKAELLKRRLGELQAHDASLAAKNRVNPSELLVMGANPGHTGKEQEIKIPIPGGEVTIRTNPEPNPSFKQHSNALAHKLQRESDERYLAGLQQSAREARKREREEKKAHRATRFRFGHGKEMARALYGANPAPICGHMIGGYPCTRKPGHRGPHLPQGATMRTRSRLRRGWQPNPSAEALREKFTGAPVERVRVMSEPHMQAGDYAQLGKLLSLYVKPSKGGQVLEIKASGGTIIVADESARQIYFVGGDQDVSADLSAFGAIDRGAGLAELGEARRIDYRQRKEHVPHPESDSWRHDFGEENGIRPRVMFDARTKRLSLEGGDYRIEEAGIIN